MIDDALSAFDIPRLDRLHQTYLARQDSASAARVKAAMEAKGGRQSTELANGGRLYAHTHSDPAGRTITTWTGDNMAWMQLFMTPGCVGKLDTDLAREASRMQEQAARELRGQ
ncbi:MAG TPA: hypothetical protein VND19_18705 [Acetobacteraceae bacterium]|nr:hypothetical protein [Acetobacteraceae bacterium]